MARPKQTHGEALKRTEKPNNAAELRRETQTNKNMCGWNMHQGTTKNNTIEPETKQHLRKTLRQTCTYLAYTK